MKQVLIVDDAEQIRQRLVRLLAESHSIRVVGQAGDAEQALAALQLVEPDTVIVDIHMPGRNGIELLKEIKSRYPGMSVIILTNYDFAEYRRQCKQLGADHFLNKTMEFDKIVDAVMDA